MLPCDFGRARLQVLNCHPLQVNTSGIKLSALSSEQIRAARALLRWEQRDLAKASGVSLPSVKRLETQPGPLAAQERTISQLRRALEKAGIEFILENGGGAGVRLKKRSRSR
jgi:hypothetical protein